MKKFFTLTTVCALFLALFSGCEKEVKVSGIIVEPKDLYLSKGDVVQLACLVTPYSADNKSVKWTSKDDAIATVSQTGLVTAISEGKTKIIAATNDGHFTDTVSVTVFRGSPAGDSIALLKLYEIAENLNWDLTKNMDEWDGVVLNNGRRVLHINGFYYYVSISKPLDSSIANLACLKSLSLTAPYATTAVTIPPEIGMLTELQDLAFFTGFTGTIPHEIGNLSKLEQISIYDNSLTGDIPENICNLTELKALSLSYNLLTGNIPKELGKLVKLEILDLGGNLLTGEIPQELGKLTNLWNLRLSHNQLTGNIPKELENLRNLNWLNLYNNSLSGHIPQSLLDKFGKWAFCPQKGTNFDNLNCDD